MSQTTSRGERRRRQRVQGGWATSSSPSQSLSKPGSQSSNQPPIIGRPPAPEVHTFQGSSHSHPIPQPQQSQTHSQQHHPHSQQQPQLQPQLQPQPQILSNDQRIPRGNPWSKQPRTSQLPLPPEGQDIGVQRTPNSAHSNSQSQVSHHEDTRRPVVQYTGNLGATSEGSVLQNVSTVNSSQGQEIHQAARKDFGISDLRIGPQTPEKCDPEKLENLHMRCSPQSQKKLMFKMMAEMPKGFSWIEEGLLCGLAFPDRPQHIQHLVDCNVRYLVNLTEERTSPTHNFPDIRVVRIGIRDFSPPTIDQVQQFLAVVEQARKEQKAVAVHCNMGKGRTGTLLACFLIACHNMAAVDAIHHLKKLRPGSIQTRQQKHCVHMFEEDHLKKGV